MNADCILLGYFPHALFFQPVLINRDQRSSATNLQAFGLRWKANSRSGSISQTQYPCTQRSYQAVR